MIELAEQTAWEITDPDDQTRAVAAALVAVDLDCALIVAGQADDPAALAAADRELHG